MCFKVALENAAATLRLRHACQLVFGIAASPVIRDKPEPQQPIPSPLLLKGTCMLAQHISNMLHLLPHLHFNCDLARQLTLLHWVHNSCSSTCQVQMSCCSHKAASNIAVYALAV